MNRFLLLLLPFLLLVPDSVAQDLDRFTFGGEIRQRSELDHRFTDQDASFFHLLRTRLNARVEATPDIDVFVQVQDSRLFGGGNPNLGRGTLDPEAGSIGLHQAYFQINNLFDTPLSLRVGRQQLALGNQRLVGAVNWSNVGRSFDAARLTYQNDFVQIDAFAARLVDTPLQSPDSQNFFGLYTTWSLAAAHELEIFALLDNDTEDVPTTAGGTENRLIRVTPGATLRGAVGAFRYELEAAYQGGRVASPLTTFNDRRATIDANFQSARLTYVADAARNVTLESGFTRLSGTDDSSDESGTFLTLFATNHQFYGFMDYFPALFTARGLQNAFGRVSGNVSDAVRLSLAVHNFRTDTDVRLSDDADEEAFRSLGQEIDLTLSYQAHANATITAGVSTFFSNTAMEAAIGDDTPFWGYVMTTIRF